MSKNKSTISGAKSYYEMAEFWDDKDAADYWDKTNEAEFEVRISSEHRYYALERNLSEEMNRMAKLRGVTVETLLNLWIKEKLLEQKTLQNT